MQSYQEAHKNESTKVSMSTIITIPFPNSSWRKRSITLVHDAAAALASFITVRSHFESIMVSPTAPPVPASVALSDCSSIPQKSSRSEQTKISEEETWWSSVLGIFSTEEAPRMFHIVPMLPDQLTSDKEVSFLCRPKPEKKRNPTGLSPIAGKPNLWIKQ